MYTKDLNEHQKRLINDIKNRLDVVRADLDTLVYSESNISDSTIDQLTLAHSHVCKALDYLL